jgi:hypothetical protein
MPIAPMLKAIINKILRCLFCTANIMIEYSCYKKKYNYYYYNHWIGAIFIISQIFLPFLLLPPTSICGSEENDMFERAFWHLKQNQQNEIFVLPQKG